MKMVTTPFEGLYIVEPSVFGDERGYFFESYQAGRYAEYGINVLFVQDNESMSNYGVVRGLHYQESPYSQSKLVRVIVGSVYDVALDLRHESPTFGRWFGLELSADNKRQLFIPKGFAHGFSVTSERAIFSYKCDHLYHKEAERSINFADPSLAIDWMVPPDRLIASSKDSEAPLFDRNQIYFK